MERSESVLDAVLDDENFDGDDVEMADADAEDTCVPDVPTAGVRGEDGSGEKGAPAGKKKKKKRKSGKRKNRGRPDGPPTKIADINR